MQYLQSLLDLHRFHIDLEFLLLVPSFSEEDPLTNKHSTLPSEHA